MNPIILTKLPTGEWKASYGMVFAVGLSYHEAIGALILDAHLVAPWVTHIKFANDALTISDPVLASLDNNNRTLYKSPLIP